MSIYACSDLHGEFDRFMELLKLINFNSEDKMYIIGDIFDRGNKQIEILDYIREHENITLLKGNHEAMELDTILDSNFLNDIDDIDDLVEEEISTFTTYKAIVERGNEYVEGVINYIKSLPFYVVVDKYILVHASLFIPLNQKDFTLEEILRMQKEDYCLWYRDLAFNDNYMEDYTIIMGHTPTFFLGEANGRIVKKTGKIFIDCGATFGGRLAAIRLDDLKEFYVY